eukprot:jgi/Chlat1/4713/Chrsp30S04762
MAARDAWRRFARLVLWLRRNRRMTEPDDGQQNGRDTVELLSIPWNTCRPALGDGERGVIDVAAEYKGFGELTLYPDLMLHVLSFLDVRDLCTAALVCHRWRELSHEDVLWKPLCSCAWVGKHNHSLIRGSAAPKPQAEDAKRDSLTEEELCGCAWSFQLRQFMALRLVQTASRGA